MVATSLYVAAAALIVALFAGVGHESQYVFKPEVMQKIAQEAIAEGGSEDAIVAAVVKRLHASYPGRVGQNPPLHVFWFFN